jgi:diguanylate cyclase (GGDEF)-like protein/PAS domain S-box-containing protein
LQLLLDPHVVLDAVRDETGAVADFVIADVNTAAADYIRRPRSELIGARLLDVMPNQAASGMLDRYRAVLETGAPLRLDGFEYDHEVHGRRRADVSAVRVGDSIAYTFRDVTDRLEAAEQTAERERSFRSLVEVAPDVVLRIRDGRFDYLSPSVTPSLGWQSSDLLGRLTSDIIHPDDFATVLRQRANLALLDGPVRYRMRVRNSSGSYHWVEAHGELPRGGKAESGVFIGSWRLIDDQVAAEAEFRRRAATDALTGLMNRQGVLDHLAAVTERPGRSGTEIALVYADVDGFKRVNDAYGHRVGDRLLGDVAQAILSVVRQSDVVARLGGDELLIVLLGVTTGDAGAMVAEKIRAAANTVRPPATDARTLTISLGVTFYASGESIDGAIDRADRAMYQAKQAGGDCIRMLPPTTAV